MGERIPGSSMIQITPQMRVLVAVEPVDFRCGIDGLSRLCRSILSANPFDGTVFVFRSRRGTAIKCLVYDGQGFWLAQKRMSAGKFRHWPTSAHAATSALQAHEFQALLWGGDPSRAPAAPMWRRLGTETAELRTS
jgi:transposase